MARTLRAQTTSSPGRTHPLRPSEVLEVYDFFSSIESVLSSKGIFGCNRNRLNSIIDDLSLIDQVMSPLNEIVEKISQDRGRSSAGWRLSFWYSSVRVIASPLFRRLRRDKLWTSDFLLECLDLFCSGDVRETITSAQRLANIFRSRFDVPLPHLAEDLFCSSFCDVVDLFDRIPLMMRRADMPEMLEEVKWKLESAEFPPFFSRESDVFMLRRRSLEPVNRIEDADPSVDFVAMNSATFRSRIERLLFLYRLRMEESEVRVMREIPENYYTVLEGLVRQSGAFPLSTMIVGALVRPDLSVENRPGYHADSRILLLPPAVSIRSPTSPTREDAEEALSVFIDPVRGVLREFPFEDAPVRDDAGRVCLDEHGFALQDQGSLYRVAAVAMIMTAVCRSAFGVRCPIFAVTSPKPRTGKSILCEIVSLIATGRRATLWSIQGSVREEAEKRLSRWLPLATENEVVVIDNISRRFENSDISALTGSGSTRIRMYGTTREDKTISYRMTLLLNGNNLTLSGDLESRSILIKLNARMERPGERRFHVGDDQTSKGADERLFDSILSRREELFSAALTLVRFGAMQPLEDSESSRLGVVGGFDLWTRLVRDPLWSLTGVDLRHAQIVAEEESEEEGEDATLAETFNALFQAFGLRPFTTKELETRVKSERPDPLDPSATTSPLVDAFSHCRQSRGFFLELFKRRGKTGGGFTLEGARVVISTNKKSPTTTWKWRLRPTEEK